MRRADDAKTAASGDAVHRPAGTAQSGVNRRTGRDERPIRRSELLAPFRDRIPEEGRVSLEPLIDKPTEVRDLFWGGYQKPALMIDDEYPGARRGHRRGKARRDAAQERGQGGHRRGDRGDLLGVLHFEAYPW